MNWLLPAILAPAVYTVVNFLDKYVVSKKVKDYRGMVIYGTITGFIVGTLFWIFTGFPIMTVRDTFFVMLSGALTIWGSVLYFKAVSMEDASKFILYFQTTPIITLILAFLLLGEKIAPTQLVGFVLILAAVVAVSIERGKASLKISEPAILITIVNVMWALGGVIVKFAINANSFSQILSYESWGLAAGGAILYVLFPSIRKAFLESFRTVGNKALVIMFANELIFVLGKGITFYAYATGPAGLVSVVGSTQVFYGIVYGYFLTKFFPRMLKEDVSKSEIAKKIVAAVGMFVGLYLIYK